MILSFILLARGKKKKIVRKIVRKIVNMEYLPMHSESSNYDGSNTTIWGRILQIICNIVSDVLIFGLSV